MSMSATTIKLDAGLLEELQALKQHNQTLTALVRELLTSEIRRRRALEASQKYVAFMSQHPEEERELDAWSTAPLERDVTARARKKRK